MTLSVLMLATVLQVAQAQDRVTATGPELGATLEDRVEITWSTAAPVATTSTFRITRDDQSDAVDEDELISVAASTESLYADFTAIPGVTYEYCVLVRDAAGVETSIGCDNGERVIARPTGFAATDGGDERHVALSWSAQSEIAAGQNLYRDAGNALVLDGTNDYVETEGLVDLVGSYTFEFWARRASTNTDDYVINLETSPNGDPTDEDVEIGFNGAGEFVVRFGTETLTAGPYADTDWHHWAMVYDAPNRRRFLYRDGVQVATDIRALASAPTGDLEFGRRDKNGSTPSRGHFDGDLDEIRYWSKALTEPEIASSMTGLIRADAPDLAGYWPMDAATGTGVPDVAGSGDGTLINTTGASSWSPSGAADRYRLLNPGFSAYLDNSAVIGFQTYTYRVAAFEDVNGDSVFTAGTDYESEQRVDDGWRAFLTPPGFLSATDGQFNDRVRITWTDLSVVEEGYDVFRDGALIGSLPADSTLYDDKNATGTHEYCVVATGDGQTSEQRCDEGRVGALAAPASVAASDRTFDDRVEIIWEDVADTEDGFEVYRGATGTPFANMDLLATLDAGTTEYDDRSALQDVDYDYCVRAFSLIDPLSPSYSAPTCDTGARRIILDPTDLTATTDLENTVELAWNNPATTTLVFQVYRDDMLIEVLDASRLSTIDSGILSDTDYEYCVSGATVVGPSESLQQQIAQVLQTIEHEDAVRRVAGGAITPPQDKLAAVYEVLEREAGTVNKTGTATTASSNFVESGRVCTTGRRSLAGPTLVEATDNEFESHVQVNWTDNSSVETGYLVFRTPTAGGTAVLADSLSPNRQTYGDYEGTPGVEYFYTVQAFDDDGESQVDQDEGIRTLAPPTAFTASDGASEMEVVLAWQDNSGAEVGYRIFRNGTFLDETPSNEEVYVDSVPDDLLGTTLTYELEAFDDVGASVRISNDGSTAINPPTSVNASDVYDGEIVVVWVDRSEVETGYVVTRREVGTDNAMTLTATPLAPDATLFLDTDASLSSSRVYEYCVEAIVGPAGSALASEARCDKGRVISAGGPTTTTDMQAARVWDFDLIPSNVNNSARFGASVAMSGPDVLIGIPGADGNGIISGEFWGGRAQLWSFTTAQQFQFWTLEENFEPTTNKEEYGYAVDISGNYAIVGDPFDSSFDLWKKAGAFNDWTVQASIERIATTSNSGIAVAVLDSFAVIGDNVYAGGTAPAGHGGVIICNIEAQARDETSCMPDDTSAPAPELEDLIDPANQVANAEFGAAVDITRIADSLYVIVGAPGNEQAYIFQCDIVSTDCGSTSDWSIATLINTIYGGGDRFGTDVAISPRIAAIGAPGAESFLLYEYKDSVWEGRTPFSPLTEAEGFGSAIAISDTTLLVGAPFEDVGDFEDAGAVYTMAWDSTTVALTAPIRYDGRVGTGYLFRDPPQVTDDLNFGASVDLSDAVGDGFYLVGAPNATVQVRSIFGTTTVPQGAFYSIPFGLEPPDDLILPSDVSLSLPGNVRASDGTSPDRIQVRWDDESDDEDGHLIYRSNATGQIELLAEVSPNVEFYDDTDAAPGDAYTYCVAAFYEDTETEQRCDIGWRPANGTISGRVAVEEGAGTDGALVCLDPSPNKSLVFDGAGGHVAVVPNDALELDQTFTIEAWIRPRAISGQRYIVSKDSSYALLLDEGRLRFTLFNEATPLVASFPALNVGTWYHVAVSMDGGGSNPRDITLYLDDASETLTNNLFVSPVGDSLTIGQQGDGTGYFEGEIDELRIWDVARTADEITTARRDLLDGEEESLIGYWRLDQGLRRVVPDLTESANHGRLVDGVYLTDEGVDLNVCALTGEDGNYSISDIRYGEEAEFGVIPTREGRVFTPTFKSITLTIESPVQNEVLFNDVTAYQVAGFVEYVDVVTTASGTATFTCPVPDVEIYAAKDPVTSPDDLLSATEADGSYAVALDPSVDDGDAWYIVPKYTNPANDEEVHSFSPANQRIELTDDTSGVRFMDEQRYLLSGNFSGGDPDPLVCGQDIGTATIRIYTQDGCYDRTIEVSSTEVDPVNGAGYFELELPPLNYLVEVVSIEGAPAAREAEIIAFFESLGTLEVDLTQGDASRNLTYRAPLSLTIDGFSAPTCPGDQFVQLDEDNQTLRVIPAVPIITEFSTRDLTIRVEEDYGSGTCPVNEGTVTIIDAIADREDEDVTLEIEDGQVLYTTFGASPNIFAGARIDGVDRSFQKPITAFAQVEGRPTLVETRWALVEGFRQRAETFVSATTEALPLMVLYDPPGSNSYAYLEEGSTSCTRISSIRTSENSIGATADIKIGFKASTGFSLGAHFETEFGVGLRALVSGRTGTETSTLGGGGNIEICVTTTDTYATSDNPGFVGEDIFIGAALNLIFALADVLETNGCEISLSETIATDLDRAEPFETTYAYGKSHIALSLIPELENLIRLGGDVGLTGEVDEEQQTIRLQAAVDNWREHLRYAEDAREATDGDNVSFSGGADYEYSETKDTTRVTFFQSVRTFNEIEGQIGLLLQLGFESTFTVDFEILNATTTELEGTALSTTTVGYVLSDSETGDYFSLDVGDDPRYGTKVFKTRAGRSSIPCEADTQCRDNPIISVSPPVQFDVAPGDVATFDVTLINGSESDERRGYELGVASETNEGNLSMRVGGGLLGTREYLIDPGTAMTVTMDVTGSPSAFSYRDVGLIFYPPDERPIWAGDRRQPFALSDTAFFSVFYDSTGGTVLSARMDEGWNWVSINREGGALADMLEQLPVQHGDIVRNQRSESRYDSTAGWVGNLTKLTPGEGYRVRLQEPAVLRVPGEPLEKAETRELKPGWSWIGYLPAKRLPVGDALASLKERVMPGDAIVGQNAFAQYVEGIGWVGTLRDLEPGKGYALYLEGGGELAYPETPEQRVPRPPIAREVTVDGPEWIAQPGTYEASMTVVAELHLGGVPMDQTTTKIAVFDGEEIRGTGEVHYVPALDQYLAFLLIHGDVDEERDLVVHAYDGERDALYEEVATIPFAAQQRLGQPDSPVVIEMTNAGQAPLLQDLPETFALHANFPNPFNTYTTIGYDLPEAADIELVVYDLLGRRVATVIDAEQAAGRHKAVFDGRELASGLYLYRMKINDQTHTGKMVLVK